MNLFIKSILVIWGFLIVLVSCAQSHWDIALAYRFPINKNAIHLSGHGVSWDFYFFPMKKENSSKMNFAFLGGWTWKDRLWNNRFNEEFAVDYKNNLIRTNFSGIDSLGVARLANEIEKYHGWEIPLPSYHNGIHERCFYAGLQLFFERPVQISLKLYVGNRLAVAGLDYDSACVSPGSNNLTSEYGYFYFKRPVTYGGEIAIQPFGKIVRNHSEKARRFFVSFFYEYADFGKMKFKYWSGCEGTKYIPVTSVLPEEIISKYKKDVRFGLRLGVFLGK